MELLEAMEAMEEIDSSVHRSPINSKSSYSQKDFVTEQVVKIQQKLQDAQQRKKKASKIEPFPFYWVLSKLSKLYEEYPDGVTDAIILTESMTAYYQPDSALRRFHLLQNDSKMLDKYELDNDVWSSSAIEDQVVMATLERLEQHQLVLNIDNSTQPVNMYLHQRFRSCMTFITTQLMPQYREFPLSTSRKIWFTKAKVLERKEEQPADARCLLPTPFLVFGLDANASSDQQFLHLGIALDEVDRRVIAQPQDPLLQQSIVHARVLDIGAIRPCKTPIHIQRQVILLGALTTRDPTSSQRVVHDQSGALRMLVLWDDQVALSRLFEVGDTLTIFHPFVHIVSADRDDSSLEIHHIASEVSSSQCQCLFYLEYGSATVLFLRKHGQNQPVTPQLEASMDAHSIRFSPTRSNLDDIAASWLDFPVYAHVHSIHVSHGSPLLAAYIYAYYDSASTSSGLLPSLDDKLLLSQYYLVVLVRLYDAASQRLFTVEVTGANAVKALQLRPGETIFLEGLVAIDLSDPVVQRWRNPTTRQSTRENVAFAFPNELYQAESSSCVGLLSDWMTIFGSQSSFGEPRLVRVNQLLGLLKSIECSQLIQSSSSPMPVALAPLQACITKLAWLIPDQDGGGAGFSVDATCEKGFSTMLAHRSCLRCLEMVAPMQEKRPGPRWKCTFCQEIFTGMHDTVQTYAEMLVCLDDGRQRLEAIADGATIEVICGLAAEDFTQLSLPHKRQTLRQATNRDYGMILSSCPPYQITRSENRSKCVVTTRIDLIRPIDAFKSAQELCRLLS